MLLDHLNVGFEFPLIDLSEKNISYFDYEARNADDDFLPVIEQVLEFEKIGFVSPLYWYTVSAQMKTFIDRLSDLLFFRKDLGRALAGKKTFLIASGNTDEVLPTSMSDVIRLSSQYMDMKYLGDFYSKAMKDGVFKEKSLSEGQQFLSRIAGSSPEI